MILGRSTLQWTGLVSALGGTIQVLVIALIPNIDAALVATIIGSIVAFLGVAIAFIANTATTPTADPQLKVGTMVRATDSAGTVIGHVPVPQPPEPPVAPEEA